MKILKKHWLAFVILFLIIGVLFVFYEVASAAVSGLGKWCQSLFNGTSTKNFTPGGAENEQGVGGAGSSWGDDSVSPVSMNSLMTPDPVADNQAAAFVNGDA